MVLVIVSGSDAYVMRRSSERHLHRNSWFVVCFVSCNIRMLARILYPSYISLETIRQQYVFIS